MPNFLPAPLTVIFLAQNIRTVNIRIYLTNAIGEIVKDGVLFLNCICIHINYYNTMYNLVRPGIGPSI